MIQRHSAAAMASAMRSMACGFGFAARPVAVDQDGERQSLAAGRGQVAGEGIDLVERAGLGPQAALERRVPEAAGQGAVHAGHGQGLAPRRAPGLARGVGQQLRTGAGSDAVVAAHARAVVEEEVAVVHARVNKKLPHHARALRKAAVCAVDLAQQAQQQLGVQVLADLVDHCDVLGHRHRDVRGQHLAALQRRRHRAQSSERVSLSGCARSSGKIAGSVRVLVAGAAAAGHRDPAAASACFEGRSGELRWILDGQARHGSLQPAPCPRRAPAGCRAGGPGRDAPLAFGRRRHVLSSV